MMMINAFIEKFNDGIKRWREYRRNKKITKQSYVYTYHVATLSFVKSEVKWQAQVTFNITFELHTN